MQWHKKIMVIMNYVLHVGAKQMVIVTEEKVVLISTN